MKTSIPYLTRYCNLFAEWNRKGINVDNAEEEQLVYMQNLQEKAIMQSGLSRSELALISLCRTYNIFRKVNTYSRKLI